MTLPKRLYVEVTNRCNLRCRTCVQYRGMPEAPGDLSRDEVMWIADQAPGVKSIVLHGIGEPLLNEELPQIIRGLKDRGLYVLFNSNALLLTPALSQELVSCGLDEFRASLDAAKESTYAAIRGSDKFSRVIENLATLIRMRKESSRPNPHVSAWMVGTKDTVDDLPGLILLASRIGIDEVYLQRLVYPLDGPGYGAAESDKVISNSRKEVREIIAWSASLSRRVNVRLTASGEAVLPGSLCGNSLEQAPWRRCRRPWEVAYITAWGNLLPCCISPFSIREYDSLILGNVFEQGLENIWTGEKYLEFRRRHRSLNPPECCLGCGVEWSL
ncbi:MAG: radical SAM protein [Syntrophobacteraceae bacterium]|nr:radical SAM protein [Syntrophobacteraceae bacterium]